MQHDLLTEVLGDVPHGLRVLGYFLERPMYPYRKRMVAEILKLDEDEVGLALLFYVRKQYIIKSGLGFVLNMSNPFVRAIMKFMDELGDKYFETRISPELNPEPHYFKRYPANKRNTKCINCGQERDAPVHKKWRGANGRHHLGNERVGTDKS